MTISDRRLDRVWRRNIAPVAKLVDGWAQVTPHQAGSAWVAADPTSPQLFERNRAHVGRDLEAIWRANGREVLLPLAPVIQHLAERVSPDDNLASSEISSTVYEMQ